MTAGRLAALAALLVSAGADGQGNDSAGLYLHVIPAARHAGIDGRVGETAYVELQVSSPARLAESIAATTTDIVHMTETSLVLAVDARETHAGGVTERHRQPSFVIDYDQPEVQALTAELAALLGDSPEIDDLTAFAFEAIPNKTSPRDFDLASQVARGREGDCTEHAVLLTALARATGRPARVMLGLLLIDDEARFGAYGHAWTEIHDGSGWRLADPTLPERDAGDADLRYLPLVSLENEGPGYSLELLRMVGTFPGRIELVPPPGDGE